MNLTLQQVFYAFLKSEIIPNTEIDENKSMLYHPKSEICVLIQRHVFRQKKPSSDQMVSFNQMQSPNFLDLSQGLK